MEEQFQCHSLSLSPCHVFFHLFSSYFISVFPYVSSFLSISRLPNCLQAFCKSSVVFHLFQCFASLTSSSVSLICLTKSSPLLASPSSHFLHARGLLTEAPLCEKVLIFLVFFKSPKVSTANHSFSESFESVVFSLLGKCVPFLQIRNHVRAHADPSCCLTASCFYLAAFFDCGS